MDGLMAVLTVEVEVALTVAKTVELMVAKKVKRMDGLMAVLRDSLVVDELAVSTAASMVDSMVDK